MLAPRKRSEKRTLDIELAGRAFPHHLGEQSDAVVPGSANRALEISFGPLELGDAGDVDLLDLEAELGAEPLEVGAGEVAEMAVAGDVERQPHDYG